MYIMKIGNFEFNIVFLTPRRCGKFNRKRWICPLKRIYPDLLISVFSFAVLSLAEKYSTSIACLNLVSTWSYKRCLSRNKSKSKFCRYPTQTKTNLLTSILATIAKSVVGRQRQESQMCQSPLCYLRNSLGPP
jgi:hypothetical protein